MCEYADYRLVDIIICLNCCTGPSGSLQNLSISVLSPSSVKISWLPPPRDSWNGIIASYTILTHSLGPNNLFHEDGLEPSPAHSSQALETSSTTLSIEGNAWSNSPDPRFHYGEVEVEETTLQDLHEYFTYKFTVYMSNSAGDSDMAESPPIQLPGTGR